MLNSNKNGTSKSVRFLRVDLLIFMHTICKSVHLAWALCTLGGLHKGGMNINNHRCHVARFTNAVSRRMALRLRWMQRIAADPGPHGHDLLAVLSRMLYEA